MSPEQRVATITAANLTLADLARPACLQETSGYRLVEEIGRGGSAVVYQAVQLEMNREVAVKVLFPPFRMTAC